MLLRAEKSNLQLEAQVVELQHKYPRLEQQLTQAISELAAAMAEKDHWKDKYNSAEERRDSSDEGSKSHSRLNSDLQVEHQELAVQGDAEREELVQLQKKCADLKQELCSARSDIELDKQTKAEQVN